MARLTFAERYLAEAVAVLDEIDPDQVEAVARGLAMVRDQGGRLFVIGTQLLDAYIHPAVVDLRSVADIEAYEPGDLYGWQTVADWLRGSRLQPRDGLLVFALVSSVLPADDVELAVAVTRDAAASVFGVLGRDGGYIADAADVSIVIPPMFPERALAHCRALCAVIWQLLVSHPILQRRDLHWERAGDAGILSRARRSPSAAKLASKSPRIPSEDEDVRVARS
jgi:D-sedoheptulose 7-phosphate isomerase